MEQYDIFISCKSEDYEIAEKVYSFLKDNGFSVFLSSKELRRMAQADYMDAISVALDTTYSMIVISTQKEYLTSKWVKFEWSTFLNEILSGRKTGQIMTLLDKIGVSEMPIQLRKYESFTLENYEDILPYLEKPKKPEENHETDAAEVHIKTDIPCRVLRFNKGLITVHPDGDNLIHLKKGSHELTFVSLENEQDNYSQVYTVRDECEILQVNLTIIRDARLAKEEAERRAKEEAERRARAERNRQDARYNAFKVNGKYGFKKDGVVIIPAKYDVASSFSEGLSMVKLNGKYGFIDHNGNEVIPLRYNFAWDFSKDLAKVKLNGKYGFINRIGKEVIPIKYDYAGDFSEGLAKVELNGKWGFVDFTGNEVTPIKYDYVGDFSEGLAKVELNGKCSYVERRGKEVVPIKNDCVGDISNGLAKVDLKGKCDYVERSAKEEAERRAKAEEESKRIAEDDAKYKTFKENGKYGFKKDSVIVGMFGIKKQNIVVIPPKYVYAENFSGGLAKVKHNGKYGFIDYNGNEVIPIKYDYAGGFSEGLAKVELNGKWGFIDRSGKKVIPNIYDCVGDFSEGLAKVELNGKYGFIDKNSTEVFSIVYDDAEDFHNGKARAKLGGKVGWLYRKTR